MFYYLYQITNLVNGKIYVGVHKAKSLDDGYMGSGKVIKAAIEKYGLENFEKVILETFENAEAMYAREKEIVDEEFLLREDTYNLRRGGNGGFDYINAIGKNKNGRLSREDCVLGGKRTAGSSLKQSHALGKIRYDTFIGKNHSDETKQKIGKANSITQHGERNSQYGTIWISNGLEKKKIRKDADIPKGWYRGRK